MEVIDFKKIAITLIFSLCNFTFLFPQNNFSHPRGLLSKDEVVKVRMRVQNEPFKTMMQTLRETTELYEQRQNRNDSDSSKLAMQYSSLYFLSSLPQDAERAWNYLSGILEKSEYLNNPVSRGLNRATFLRDMAMVYDFCYDAWTPERRRIVSEKLLFNIMTTSSNMGYDANYASESNWMGVRYGAVFFASMVGDDFKATVKTRSRLLPFEWDSRKRLFEHINANVNSNGWNTESLSYFAYNWSFVGPALVTLFNQSGTAKFKFENTFPKVLNALWGNSTASISIPGRGSKVTQPDFSDDDPMGSYYLYPIGFKLYPENQKPSLLWMYNYLSGPDTWPKDGEQLFYNIIWYPENIIPENPEKSGWLTYYDPEQGVALFRNRFGDNNDILAAFTATSKRVHGHQGNDNLGFRLIGLGSIWAVGAGRTGQIAGQSTLFPFSTISDTMTGTDSTGKVSEIRFEKDGSGSIKASGSCMGVLNHRRTFIVDYSKESGAEAVFIVSDVSDNGRTWRMNSPEFNKLEILKDGFLLTSPEGAELKAVVFSDADNLIITSKKVHYGGNTIQQNSGIAYNGKNYSWTNAIDCNTNGKITVVFTLQPKGAAHMQVSLTEDRHVKVGNGLNSNKNYSICNLQE
jgi:hypothetical protein